MDSNQESYFCTVSGDVQSRSIWSIRLSSEPNVAHTDSVLLVSSIVTSRKGCLGLRRKIALTSSSGILPFGQILSGRMNMSAYGDERPCRSKLWNSGDIREM